ncbi:MAG TPA: hypothetical protein VK040_09900 [Balneolaceae bacterium]|nr:hypothetical protein [Balneolaceae bacterium]
MKFSLILAAARMITYDQTRPHIRYNPLSMIRRSRLWMWDLREELADS